MKAGVEQAIEKAGGGPEGMKRLAELLTVSLEFIYKCKRQGWFPAERARVVSDTYGVPLVDLVRADIRAAIQAASQN